MWLKILFSLLVLFVLVVAMLSPQRRRAIHQKFVLLAKIVLIAATCGAVMAYCQRYFGA